MVLHTQQQKYNISIIIIGTRERRHNLMELLLFLGIVISFAIYLGWVLVVSVIYIIAFFVALFESVFKK